MSSWCLARSLFLCLTLNSVWITRQDICSKIKWNETRYQKSFQKQIWLPSASHDGKRCFLVWVIFVWPTAEKTDSAAPCRRTVGAREITLIASHQRKLLKSFADVILNPQCDHPGYLISSTSESQRDVPFLFRKTQRLSGALLDRRLK